jgi:hypothetical protein
VPLGVMKLKKKDFEDLKQGSMTVSEYVTHFTQLSHYAPDNVDTDEPHDFINFQDMVDRAIALENRGEIME